MVMRLYPCPVVSFVGQSDDVQLEIIASIYLSRFPYDGLNGFHIYTP